MKKRVQMDYKIIRIYNEFDLERYVNQNIKNGYKPIGGISVVQTSVQLSNELKYFQAMIKE